MIKFIDFGGACTWTPDEGLTGLVGTPQYVAPEVVTGFGEESPTELPYGKGCDMWSIGVLLYVMLSKTMPFRAKEVDQLLKQADPHPHMPPTCPRDTSWPRLRRCSHLGAAPPCTPFTQVVKGKFAFKPEDRWRNVSPSAKDLISKLLVVDPQKRLTIQQAPRPPPHHPPPPRTLRAPLRPAVP